MDRMRTTAGRWPPEALREAFKAALLSPVLARIGDCCDRFGGKPSAASEVKREDLAIGVVNGFREPTALVLGTGQSPCQVLARLIRPLGWRRRHGATMSIKEVLKRDPLAEDIAVTIRTDFLRVARKHHGTCGRGFNSAVRWGRQVEI